MSLVGAYRLPVEQVLEELGCCEGGLTAAEAQARLERYGCNELEYEKRSALLRLLDQFRSPLVYILLVAALVTAVLSVWTHEDMWIDIVVILGVVVLNVLLGFFQEGKAEAALEALKKMLVAECTAVRDGVEEVIQTRELVPGDVVVLNSGDRIPADLRLFFTKNAHADEAALTGESVPVSKHTDAIPKPDLSPADQRSMAFSGTFITRGSARGVVVATGEQTEFGKIARMVKETHTHQTPLQKKIADFTRILVIGILALGAVNFAVGIGFGYPLLYIFLATVALIVAAIPEMLPMIVTAILALGATAMAKKNALIRRLPAAETLGCTTVICSDKTGTLTKNEMTVVSIYSGGQSYRLTGVGYGPSGQIVVDGDAGGSYQGVPRSPELLETLVAGHFCNTTSLTHNNGQYRVVGDPTEGALVVSAAKAGITERSSRLDEIPFDSELMYMATLHPSPREDREGNVIYVKGSPERVLDMCQSQMIDGYSLPIDRAIIRQKANEMASDALRVLGMAYKLVPREKTSLQPDDLQGLVFLGLQGMIDPPREAAIEAVRECKSAGVRTVMITGDHLLTAVAIARQLGMIDHGDDDVALSGEDLSRMSDADLYEVVGRISVYARVAPEHKLRIAEQLQKRGEIVAMTGDGVNDAPALKAADIGIAMGITGTEVSKEASSMVLTDDNFASIVAAVEEGRHAWKNLQKAILYTLPTNGGQALLIMGAILMAPFVPLFAIRLPLEAIHVLWVNMADSVFLTMPLMFEPKERNLLREPPRDPKESIANSLFFVRVGLVSIVMAATGFSIYWIYGHMSIRIDDVVLIQAQTAAFVAVQLLHLGLIITARSVTNSAFTFSPFSNKWVLAGIALTLVTQMTIVYLPLAQTVFRTAAIPLEWWPVILLALLPGFVVVEIEKAVRKVLAARKRRRLAVERHSTWPISG